MRVVVPFVVLVCLFESAAAGEPNVHERMNARLDAANAELIELRRDLHRHPEVSGHERRTAELIAARLDRLGLDVATGVGGHGVVALVRGGKPGAMVAFRADMDAVPSDAPDPVEFRSEIPGVRHICGHDVHTTIGLALAEAFAVVRDELAGTVMLIFQPAEETASGARDACGRCLRRGIAVGSLRVPHRPNERGSAHHGANRLDAAAP